MPVAKKASFASSVPFRTQFSPRVFPIYKNPGSSVHTLYSSRITDTGEVELIPSGTEDIYAAIQSHKDSCDIGLMLSRFANGDPTALSRVQGTYGDFTSMPSTYADMLNAVIAGEDYFNSLPVDVRAKFDHSLEKFIVAMDDMPDFLSKLGVSVPVPDPDPDPVSGSSESASKEVSVS